MDSKSDGGSDSESSEATVKTLSRKKAQIGRRNEFDEEPELVDDVEPAVPAPEVISDDEVDANEN